MNAPTRKPSENRILIVDDNDVFRGALKICLEGEGFEVLIAENGRVAQEIVGLGGFKAVISDIQMSPVNGIELLAFIKKTSSIPVILMTGFSDLLETQKAFSLGASGFLGKPFKSDDLIDLLNTLIPVEVPPVVEAEPESLDEQFCKLSIDDFISGYEIKFDIYIRFSETKYVKIAHQGENIPIERVKVYKSKGLNYLYMTRNDFKKYMNFNLLLKDQVVKSPKIDKIKKIQFLHHTQEIILEQLYQKEFSPELFEYSKSTLESTISLMTESSDLFKLMNILNLHSDYLYSHSLGVSLYGLMIAKEMGWSSPNTLMKIAMGGLFHDIGKKEIDRNILMKPREDLTPEEIKVLETHTLRGMEILAQNQGIPSDVLQIILQHHENSSGTGYPANRKKDQIHPLARLIAVANAFCNFMIKGPEHSTLSVNEALSRIETLYADQLDPVFVQALMRLCNYQSTPMKKTG